jgi:DNA-binding HxlR family transcriptional regulator
MLRRLRELERDGLLVCTGGPDGYYGYSWRITEAGHASLAAPWEPGSEVTPQER